MDRVQLTDEEIEALAFRMEKEGHHLTAGTMRLVETLIAVRLQVENEYHQKITAAKDILEDRTVIPTPRKKWRWYR